MTLGSEKGTVNDALRTSKKNVSVPLLKTFKVAGSSVYIHGASPAHTYAVTVFSLSGRRIAETITAKEIVALDKDLGLSKGAFLVKITPVGR